MVVVVVNPYVGRADTTRRLIASLTRSILIPPLATRYPVHADTQCLGGPKYFWNVVVAFFIICFWVTLLFSLLHSALVWVPNRRLASWIVTLLVLLSVALFFLFGNVFEEAYGHLKHLPIIVLNICYCIIYHEYQSIAHVKLQLRVRNEKNKHFSKKIKCETVSRRGEVLEFYLASFPTNCLPWYLSWCMCSHSFSW